MANFYDVLIDTPSAFDWLKELLVEWEKKGATKKEAAAKCTKYVEALKQQLEEEYKKKA